MTSDSADRPATLTDVEITPAMTEAGVDAFARWFRQPGLEGLLIGLPERPEVAALAQSTFASMMSARPDD